MEVNFENKCKLYIKMNGYNLSLNLLRVPNHVLGVRVDNVDRRSDCVCRAAMRTATLFLG